MCVACKFFNVDCSQLDFEFMPVHSEDDDTTIVICTNFEREKRDAS